MTMHPIQFMLNFKSLPALLCGGYWLESVVDVGGVATRVQVGIGLDDSVAHLLRLVLASDRRVVTDLDVRYNTLALAVSADIDQQTEESQRDLATALLLTRNWYLESPPELPAVNALMIQSLKNECAL